jgi:hypothetical protein
MSTRPCRRAPGFIFTSFLLPALMLAMPPVVMAEALPARGNVELELELASKKELYVVIDPWRQTVELKARGLVLYSMALAGFALQSYRVGGEPATSPLALPSLWTVEEDAAAATRKLIAPKELVPYSEDAEPPVSSTPSKDEKAPPPPTTYQVRLDGGYQLWVGEDLPGTSWWNRLGELLRDGWASWRGRQLKRPPRLALAMDRDGGQRLLHIMRPGLKILVLAPAALPVAGS